MLDKVCCIDGCNNVLRGHTARGMCKTHYNRFLQYGNPLELDHRKLRERQKCKVAGCTGRVRSGGCCYKHYRRLTLYGDVNGKHFKYKHNHRRENRSWYAMCDRCYNQKHPQYNNYGGRGIKVCDRWLGEKGFENFYNDMGKRPERFSLDRIDVNGNYCPENCRWLADKDQNNNKRNSHFLTIGGKTKTVAQWASEYGINYSTLMARVKYGWAKDKLLVKPQKKEIYRKR